MHFPGVLGTRLVLSHNFTIEELFGRICQVPFEAGHPKLIKLGSSVRIIWPPMGRSSQIQIIRRGEDFYCRRCCWPVSLTGNRANCLLQCLLSLIGTFGQKKRDCKALAEKTGRQINALLL